RAALPCSARLEAAGRRGARRRDAAAGRRRAGAGRAVCGGLPVDSAVREPRRRETPGGGPRGAGADPGGGRRAVDRGGVVGGRGRGTAPRPPARSGSPSCRRVTRPTGTATTGGRRRRTTASSAAGAGRT